ncbi:MAG: LuxR C-terminal-related transcriptional regulator [Magnetospirillum sp. WYHS-4]
MKSPLRPLIEVIDMVGMTPLSDIAAAGGVAPTAGGAIVVILDGEGRIAYVNDSWRNFCLTREGESPSAWLGRNFLDICRQAQIDEGADGMLVSAALADLLSGKRKRFEIVYACRQGKCPRWFKMLCRGVSNSSSIGAVVMLIDVTEMHLGERLVRESEDRLCAWIEEDRESEDLDGPAIEAVLSASRPPEVAPGVNLGTPRPRVSLSPREAECLLWTAYGLRSKEIAEKLGITTKTVEHHLAKAKDKLGSKNRVEAVMRAVSLGLIRP